MDNYFNKKTLLLLTLLIFVLGIASYFDDELAMVTVMLAGFIYTAALWIALKTKPKLWRFWTVFFILVTVNYFSMFAATPLELLPQPIADRLVLVPPSLAGAAVTILCIMKLWKVDLTKHQILLIIGLIFTSSLMFNQVNFYVRENFTTYGFTVIFNSVLWWLMFSLGIILPDIYTNKSIKNPLIDGTAK